MSKIRDVPEPPFIYKSSFGAGYVKATQYIAETMCRRRAAYEHITLPQLFWRSDSKWKTYYQLQVRLASSLLLGYDADVILEVLKRQPKTFSLQSKFLLEALEKFSLNREVKDKELETNVVESKTWGVKPSKMKVFDGEEEGVG